MANWDAGQYLKFAPERQRPALDLLARIPLEDPSYVYDLGCGTASSTRLLVERWPRAEVVGVDSSPEMLAAARSLGLDARFVEAGLASWQARPRADLLFSNAALHWVEDHARLFPRLVSQLRPGGALAAQMPRSFASPSHSLLRELLEGGGPGGEPLGTPSLRARYRRVPTLEPAEYYDLLAPLVGHLDIWQTEYLHVLAGADPVLEWVRGTALRPLIDELAEPELEQFLEQYRQRLALAYPARSDGSTLYPFARLFIVARR